MKKHRYIKMASLLLAGIVMACGKSPSTTEPATTTGAASASQPASKGFPPEYRILAAAIARPMTVASSAAKKSNANISELISSAQSRILDLRGIHSTDDDLNYVSSSAIDTIEDLIKQIEALEISAKSRPNSSRSSVGPLVSAAVALKASNPIGLLEVFAQMVEHQDEANSKNNAWIQELRGEIVHVSSDAEKLQAAAMLLPKIAAKYAAPISENDGNINIHFMEAWGPMGPDDVLSINNNGADLTDCTISIKLIGAAGEEHTNVHFIPLWKRETLISANYQHGLLMFGETLNRSTVAHVQKIVANIQSATFSTQLSYPVDRQERDNQITAMCKPLKLTGTILRKPHILTPTTYTAQIVLDGVPFVPKGQLDLVMENQVQTQAFHVPFNLWNRGVAQTIPVTFRPDSIHATITFPDTRYKYTTQIEP